MKMYFRLSFAALILVSVALSPGAGSYAMSSLQDYSDEFNSSILDPKWWFENPAPNPEGQSWSLTSPPGFLTMTTTGPTDLIGATNTSPRMLQDAPEGDFEIVIRVLADPDVSFEHAGILVIESPTSWVRLIRDSRYNSVFLQTGPSAAGAYVPFPGTDVVLKLTKEGSTYQGYYSVNGGSTFSYIGEVQGPSSPPNIGMTIASTPEGNIFTVQFDYFRVSDGTGGEPQHWNVPTMTITWQVILVLLLIGLFIVVRKKALTKH